VSRFNTPVDEPSAGLALTAFSIPTKKLAMWLFIIADMATFAACLIAYAFLRNANPAWPRPFHSLVNVGLMTFILITSSLTVLFAIESARSGDKPRAIRWLLVTSLLGALFALLHLREWHDLMSEGMTLFKNPWNTPLFGAAFFSITGLHLLHVTGGVIALLAVARQYQRGRYGVDDLEITGLYWHFVDLVWMFVVPLVYLLNYSR